MFLELPQQVSEFLGPLLQIFEWTSPLVVLVCDVVYHHLDSFSLLVHPLDGDLVVPDHL